MFEAAELGREISKREFKKREPVLHTRLLEVQRELRGSTSPVIVILSGVEGAGKGEVVNRLHEWLDARGVEAFAFWDESDEERERPAFWRFWRTLPARGTVGIMFGSWYTRPIIDRVFRRIRKDEYDHALSRIAELENMLAQDGAIIVKLWFHLSKDAQRSRLKADAKKGGKKTRTSPFTKKFSKRYDRFIKVSERAVRLTDSETCPWHIVESEDRNYRDITVGTTLLEAISNGQERARVKQSVACGADSPAPPQAEPSNRTVLDQVDTSAALAEQCYKRKLSRRQNELYGLAWRAKAAGVNTVAIFEGWDAAGKGGAIRRVTAGLDARLYRVISIAAPTDEEKARHYLWRFWRHVPRAGHITIYDRSWYGRVLVERVEAFAKPNEWMRAYQEINDFEEQLREHGVVLLKFWFHISKDEQLRRFKERECTPWKRHKITDEDWRNRESWEKYEVAVNDMVARTSTSHAPWILVPGNDKKFARVEVISHFCRRLRAAL